MFKGKSRIACLLSAALLLTSIQVPVFAAPEENNSMIIEDNTENLDNDNEIHNDVSESLNGNKANENPRHCSQDTNNVRNLRRSGRTLLTSSVTQTDGNFKYTVNDDGSATVTGLANGVIPSGDLNIPSTIGGYTVTVIGKNAFTDCGFTGRLTIPDSVTTIGENAFNMCGRLTGDLTIPDSVITIGDSAFNNCSGLTGNLTIGDNVESIGVLAFYGCSGLTGNLIIPDSVTSIGADAFYGCSGFTGKLMISSSVTTIGNFAFYGCSCLTGNLTIPNGVTTIGKNAFYECGELKGKLTIPDSVTSIGPYAFYCCGFTGKLNIPDSVTSIGEWAFYGCSGFTGNLILPDKITSIKAYTFGTCSGLTGVLTIPDSVTSIEGGAFAYCSGLNAIVIPDSVTFFEYDPISCCEGLIKVVNHSDISISLTDCGNGRWINESTGQSITEIKNGVAIRVAYAGERLTVCFSTGTSDVILTQQIVSGKTIDEPSELVRSDYEFTGWYTDDECTKKYDFSKPVTNHLVLYAGWKLLTKTVTVSFDSMGGSPVPPQTVKEGSLISKPNSPYKNCQEFVGWYTEAGCINRFDFSKPVTKDAILYAGWKGITVESVINGKGKANYQLLLLDSNGSPLTNTNVTWCFYDTVDGAAVGGNKNDITNDEGYVLIKSDMMTYNSSNSAANTRKYEAKITYTDGTGAQNLTINFNILITPLSFSQTWSLSSRKSVGAEIGPKTGFKLGPAEAEFSVAKAGIKGEQGSTLSATHEYDNGHRNLILMNTYDASVGINGSLGPTVNAKLVPAGIDMSAFTVKGDASVGGSVHTGTRIENYDPNDLNHRKDIGLFMLGTMATATGNAFVVQLANALGMDCYNQYGGDASVHINANASALDIEVGNTTTNDTVASGTFGKIDYDSKYTYGAEQIKGVPGYTRYMQKDSAVTGTLAEANIKAIGWSGTPSGWGGDIGLNKNYAPQRYKLEASPDSFLVEQQISKEDLDISSLNISEEEKEQYKYKKEKFNDLFSSVPEFKKFADGKSLFILDSMFKDINDKLDKASVEAEYSRTKTNKAVISTGDLDIGAQLGVGFDVGMCLSGIFGNKYVIQSGKFKNGKTNVTAINYIDEMVSEKEIDIVTLIKEPLVNIANDAKSLIIKITGSVGQAIQNAFAFTSFVGANINRKLNIVSVSDDDGSITSFVITSYGGKDLLSLSSVGDGLKGEAVSVGYPYYVYVTEDGNDTAINDFSDTPVELRISYSDEMLSNINATSEDEKDIEMFKYDQDKCGYVSIGGTVDETNNTVSVIITEPGQFMLAINRKLSSNPVNGSEGTIVEQTLAKTSSISFNAGGDIYSVSWNSFVQFDGRKHNGVGTDESGYPFGVKESGKKVCDLKLFVTKNGDPVPPSKYTVKTKNNKNASVSIDGITPIQTNPKKLPTFKLKFKGKEYKDANKAVKNESFEIGIIPAELKQELITFDKVKTGKDGSIEIKKMTFYPEPAVDSVTPKPVKMKWNKKENKTDFITESDADGTVKVLGKNNYYGSVVYK